MDEAPNRQYATKKTFVLCFDGTGNKFSGTDSDSNILKIYRMLDRTQGMHYYQPGIGTYVTTSSLEHTSVFTRFRSWYDKAKDSAVGSSFAAHVMGGYRFLMRYYSPEDDIYFFGFSRGAYTARFLAEMIDHLGLLSAGNEELVRFAWKTFSKWQSRRGGDSTKAKEGEDDMYTFMKNFRETFSRPVRRIRFLGLFDTVNSVPRFENAWMQRSKFPYTARSSAKFIRHAVSIDERRAKFRQDLITGSKPKDENPNINPYHAEFPPGGPQINGNTKQIPVIQEPRGVSGTASPAGEHVGQSETVTDGSSTAVNPMMSMDQLHQDFVDAAEHQHASTLDVPAPKQRKSSFAEPVNTRSTEDLYAASHKRPGYRARAWSDHSRSQDIEEVWFVGCHADIGGGWPKARERGEKIQLSHAPLCWMVQEAEAAGLKFDKGKVIDLNCCPDKIDEYGNKVHDPEHSKRFHETLHTSGVAGLIHDCLKVGEGLPLTSVLSWNLMEFLPFRRMNLKSDGSWDTIRWPLPGGETRDIPNDAKIHNSVIRRMEQDEKYRPGNLIVGGGGRGVRTAPKVYGIGEWDLYRYGGDPVKEQYVRRNAPGTVLDEKA